MSDDDAEARRRRRAEDTRRCRSRQRRCVQLYSVEIGGDEITLAIRYGGLRESEIMDKRAVSVAIGKLLHRALISLLREGKRR
jgi:hypothetical protein